MFSSQSTCILFWARPVRFLAWLAEGVVYDLGVITLERSVFRLCVYKPPIAVYRKVGLWWFLQPQAHFRHNRIDLRHLCCTVSSL